MTEIHVENEKRYLGLPPAAWVILCGAAAKILIHMLTGSLYGYMSDELYFAALGRHLAFGYVDVPPIVPLLAAGSRLLFGESLPAMHLLPALAGAGTLVLACLMTRELGGRVFAVGLTALAFLAVPAWLTFDSVFTYDCFDQLLLAAFLLVLVRLLRSGNLRLWIPLGALAGLACMTKMTLALLGPGFLAALLISRNRRDLLTPWPWLGALIWLALIAPYILWNAANHWVTLQYWGHYGSQRVYRASLPEYATNVFYSMNPVLLPLYAFGLFRIFRRPLKSDHAFLGIMFVVSLAVVYLLHARTWMLAGMFLPLIAAGSTGLEEILEGLRPGGAIRISAAALVLAGGALVAPANLPIVPIKDLPAYAHEFNFLYRPIRDFDGDTLEYPSYFSLRIGWEDFVRRLAGVYDSLPPQERKAAGIYAGRYHAAAAIDFFGPRYGLPRAVSDDLTYFLWGPGESSWDVMLVVTNVTNDMAPFFETCQRMAMVKNDANSKLDSLFVFVCRHPKVPPSAIWKRVKF